MLTKRRAFFVSLVIIKFHILKKKRTSFFRLLTFFISNGAEVLSDLISDVIGVCLGDWRFFDKCSQALQASVSEGKPVTVFGEIQIELFGRQRDGFELIIFS